MERYTYIDNLETWKKEFHFSITVKVRFSETDAFGHMNNVSAFIYFEEGRIAFFKQIGLFNLSENPSHVPLAADLQCDFHQQVYFDETLYLYMKANTIGNSSVDIHYMAVNQAGGICLTGRGTLVKINAKSGKSVPFTKDERAKLLDRKMARS